MSSKLTFSEKQVLIARMQILAVFVLLILFLLVVSRLALLRLTEGEIRQNFLWFGLLCIGVGAAAEHLYAKFSKRLNLYLDQKFLQNNTAEKGIEGEDLVETELKRILDEGYRIYKNFKIPGREFDIDFVIVGPRGIILLEVKNYSEKIIFSDMGATIIRRIGYKTDNIRLFDKNDPRRQVIYHSVILNQYLRDLGFGKTAVREKALVFVADMTIIEGEAGVDIVSGINNLRGFIEAIPEDKAFTAALCTDIGEAFERAWK
jgi:hypothetical protein